MKPISHQLPVRLRELIERGEEVLPARKLFVRAVVGTVYLKGQKPGLAEFAHRLATESGMIVLHSNSKEILFLANYFETANWPLNLISYFETLMLKTGARIKCAASQGPAVLLYTGDQLRLESEEADLAPRLARAADPGQMVMTSKVWHALSDSLKGWMTSGQIHSVTGFAVPIPTVHLESRLNSGPGCNACGGGLEVRQTAEGYIYAACPKNHPQDGLTEDTVPFFEFKRTG